MIHNDYKKRLYWSLGVVEKRYSGRDGIVGMVNLGVPSGAVISRDVKHLHSLELGDENNGE